MSNDFPADAFWEWSLHIYGLPDVAPACLRLQELQGVDVNVILFCCWTGSSGRRLDKSGMQRVLDDVTPWQRETVRPLRALRRLLKPGFDPAPADLVRAVRSKIASAELAAEHLEQVLLSRHAGDLLPHADDRAETMVAGNLAIYAEVAGFEWSPSGGASLRIILRSVVPDAAAEDIRSAVLRLTAGPVT